MADEETLPVEGEADRIDLPDDEGGNPPDPNTNDADPIASLASELGWVPKDKFTGPEDQWKPAADFIKAGREINNSYRRDVKALREQVERQARVSAQLLEDKLAEKEAYYAAQHRQAVEDGDYQRAEAASRQRTEVQAQRQNVTTDNTLPPETASFIERNKAWFNVDPLATDVAQSVAERLAAAGHSTDVQLREAERAVKKQFPELFPAPPKAPPGVQTAQSRATNSTSRKRGFADMPAESQAMARDYQKRHGIPPEKFAESYWQQESNRRVG